MVGPAAATTSRLPLALPPAVVTVTASVPVTALELTVYCEVTSPHPGDEAVPNCTPVGPPGLFPFGSELIETCVDESRHAPRIEIVPLDVPLVGIINSLIGCPFTRIELIVGGEQAVGLESEISLVVSGGTSTGALQPPLEPIHGS
jgi:hypothetical protein